MTLQFSSSQSKRGAGIIHFRNNYYNIASTNVSQTRDHHHANEN